MSGGTNVRGDKCLGGQMSWGDRCPGGTLVQGDKCRGDTCPGGHLSRGTNVGGTVVGGTNVTPPHSNLKLKILVRLSRICLSCKINELCNFLSVTQAISIRQHPITTDNKS